MGPCLSIFCVIVEVKSLSRVRLFSTSWTIAYKAPLSMESSRQEYWSGLLFPIPGDLPDPGIKSVSLVYPAFEGRLFTIVPPGEPTVGLKRRSVF